MGALRRRADTHTSSTQLRHAGDRSSFLGLPPQYGGLMFDSAATRAANDDSSNTGMQDADRGYMKERGFMNCFFWCGHTEERDEDDEREDLEDVATGLPDVRERFHLKSASPNKPDCTEYPRDFRSFLLRI